MRAKLIAVGASALAESPGFLHLFRFEIEQGGNDAYAVLVPLYEYHEMFVNPKMRRLREHHFKDVVAVDEPWLRLALIQAAYSVNRDKIRDSWIDYFGPTHMSQVMKSEKEGARKLATKILKTFHRQYARQDAYKHLPDGQRAMLLGRLGVTLGRVLLGKEGHTYEETEIEHVAWTFEQELRKGMPPDVVEALGVPLGRAKTEEPTPSALAEEPKKEIAPAETIAHKEGAQSRLLMVEAKFLQPMAGNSSVRLIAGHLHNTVAKKPNSADYIHF